MTYFDQTRSKKSAIKEGVTDVLDINDERKAEEAKLEQMHEQTDLEDAAALRNLICMGRYVDSPGMMTLEEHKDALDAIDATPEERQDYDYRVLQSDHLIAKARLDDESELWVRDVDHDELPRTRLSAPRPVSVRPNFHLGSFY